MPIKWKSPDRFKPALVLNRIAAVRTVNPSGGATYVGFELEECLPTLQSMLVFPKSASETDVHTMAWQALSRVREDLNPETFLAAINQVLRDRLATRQSKYTLLTELSLDPTGLLSRRLFHRQFPELFPSRFSWSSRTDDTGEIALGGGANREDDAVCMSAWPGFWAGEGASMALGESGG